MQWFKEGERNNKFCHTVLNGRIKRLRVSRIQIAEGEWLENQEDIAQAAVAFYKDQFTLHDTSDDFEMLNELPVMIT